MKRLSIVLILIGLVFSAQSQICGTPGLDGAVNISGSINTYFPVAGDVTLTPGSKTVKLDAVPSNDPYGNSFGTKAIEAGDMLLLIQMQDATINAVNSDLYGSNNQSASPDNLGGTGFTDLGNTGVFEYVIATSAVPLSGGNLSFRGAGPDKGTVNSYFNAAATTTRGKRTFQIVRVPQYSNLILSSDIKTPPFNGKAGGIIAFDVSGSMNFNGHTIDASERGFRGGYGLVAASKGNINSVYMTSSSDSRSVGKGEGIAGTPRFMWDGYNQVDNVFEGLPGGSYGKGAPGNAGGGGCDHNAGGGGGGNGGFGGVGGDGTHDVKDAPYTFPNGGRPGSVAYSGVNPEISRIIMGGGGGGGDANDALNGVKGGVGGGIVLINVGRITGTGTVLANGGKGAIGAKGAQPDGAGGGGAGGTVYIKVTNPDPLAHLIIEAKGGQGGNTEGDTQINEHGPGGGGGGGLVFYAMSSGTVNVNINKGSAGKAIFGNGTSNGATDGTNGRSVPFQIVDLPAYLQGGGSGCYPELTTVLSNVTPLVSKFPGSEVTYTVKTSNYLSGGNAGGVQIEVQLPVGFTFKSADVIYNGTAGGPLAITNKGTADKPLFGDFNLGPGDDVTITLKAEVDCGTSPSTYHASAQALYLDPSRTINDPDRRITGFTNAFPGAKVTHETGSSGNVAGSNFNGNSSSNDDVKIITATPIANNLITAISNPVQLCVNKPGDLADPPVINGSTPTGGIEVYAYQWQSSTDNSTFTDIINATEKDFDPDSIAVTTYYRRRVISSSCSFPGLSNSNVIKVTVGVIPKVDVELPDFCLNDGTATFINNSTVADGSVLTYKWDFGDNTPPQTSSTHAYSTTGDYKVTLTATSANGCSATQSYPFKVNGGVEKAEFEVVNYANLCSGKPVEFVDKSRVSFGEVTRIEWHYDDLNHSNDSTWIEVDEHPTLRANRKYFYQYPPNTSTASQFYKVVMKVYSGQTCAAETFDIIEVHPTPVVEFDHIPAVCLNDEKFQIVEARETTGVTGSGVFSGEGVSEDGIFDPLEAGIGTHKITYTYTAEEGNCTDFKSQDIVVYPSPTVSNNEVEMLFGGEVTLPSLTADTGLMYSWSPAVSLSKTDILNPIASPLETITYTLTATNPITSCSSSGTVKVIVHKVPVVPNTFTPNGDLVNDLWEIEYLDTYKECTVTVFNRFGEKVYFSKGYSSPWDGMFEGKPLPAGAYYYIIDPKKGRKPLSGSITILR